MALSEKDLEAKINTVIQGDYTGEDVKVVKGCVVVGDKIVNSQTCEKCEVMSEDGDSDNVKKAKRGFALKAAATVLFPPAAIVTAKSGYKDLHSFGKLVKLTWRNGMESLLFVDDSIAKKIGKVFF
ncbi:MAG: hypothetical protein SPL61_05670 [Saccharofermentans sp.]|nr:hypothetical protein [Saccharofermentans sp.]